MNFLPLTAREKKLVLALALVTGIAIVSFFWEGESPSNNLTQLEPYTNEAKEEKEKGKKPKSETWVIDIKGAVKKPGIYHLKPPVRIYQVVEAADGVTDQADLRQVNLAAVWFTFRKRAKTCQRLILRRRKREGKSTSTQQQHLNWRG